KDISFKDIKKRYDAVYIATGSPLPEKINIPGEVLPGVIHGLNFLKSVNLGKGVAIGKTVAVIGGGNTAIDSARTAVRLGAEKVIILYRRTIDAMPALKTEIREALYEGVEIMELVSPVKFIAGKDGKLESILCRRMALSNFDKTGRRRTEPIEGSEFLVHVDTCIPAVSQYSDLPFIKKEEVSITPWGTFVIDTETQMTTMEGVFAGGDVVRGPDTVIWAIADGKKAASSIDKYLGGTGKLNKGMPIDIPDVYDEDEVVTLKRFPMEMLSVEERKDTFDEVIVGYHKLNAIAESMRCLHCERR
ncbi:MAG TPA: FAD-dependent oxidoreductase, partial [Clostridia bacterium]|nr:FAD-dependent oxidoreductase [Clostridia bacterium]